MSDRSYKVVVIGGGHAGAEAAWACANVLAGALGEQARGAVALVTLDPSKIGVMSCNPAIGGLAKGQLVREVDALNGLMGLATDATGIQFKVLNASKGPAVHGPRAQCDKHAYAEEVQRLLAGRPEIEVVPGSVERLLVEAGRISGVAVSGPGGGLLRAPAVVLTTGTFMRGLMHTGETRTQGGRFGEAAAVGISGALRDLGFELGRLKTGTPPRLERSTIRWDDLEPNRGDAVPTPFSDLSVRPSDAPESPLPTDAALPREPSEPAAPSLGRFPVLTQVECRQTRTTAEGHDLIRRNLHRAPMYSGQIESVGPRYCPSIEDKVVRFADRGEHGVFLEPESLRDSWVYCNGISTSLPADVQDVIVRTMPGCEQARILRYGYAVEYDMVRPHQIAASGMTKSVEGLFLAGQINGTSGYEEAAAQGLIAGLNAARFSLGLPEVVFGREEGYLGVLMDDLVTKTPVEPYRMFTSRAEHRLMLRSGNAADRLTPRAEQLGLLCGPLGELRRSVFAARRERVAAVDAVVGRARVEGMPLDRRIRTPDFEEADLQAWFRTHEAGLAAGGGAAIAAVYAQRRYAPFVEKALAEIRRQAEMEHRTIPATLDPSTLGTLRTEARQALARFRPRTFGQASRLEGVTPADVTLLAVLVERHRSSAG